MWCAISSSQFEVSGAVSAAAAAAVGGSGDGEDDAREAILSGQWSVGGQDTGRPKKKVQKNKFIVFPRLKKKVLAPNEITKKKSKITSRHICRRSRGEARKRAGMRYFTTPSRANHPPPPIPRSTHHPLSPRAPHHACGQGRPDECTPRRRSTSSLMRRSLERQSSCQSMRLTRRTIVSRYWRSRRRSTRRA